MQLTTRDLLASNCFNIDRNCRRVCRCRRSLCSALAVDIYVQWHRGNLCASNTLCCSLVLALCRKGQGVTMQLHLTLVVSTSHDWCDECVSVMKETPQETFLPMNTTCATSKDKSPGRVEHNVVRSANTFQGSWYRSVAIWHSQSKSKAPSDR